MNKRSYSLILFFIVIVIFPFTGDAATYFSRVNGNWNTASTWSTISCAGVASSTIPGAGDNVVICSGRTVTMNGAPGACLSLTINGVANWTSVVTTNVGTGGLTLNNGSSISGSVIGSLIVAGPMTVAAGGTTTISAVNLNIAGLASINGTFTDNNSGGSNTFANVDLNSTGNFNNTSAETYAITGNLNTYGGGFLAATGPAPTFNIAGNFNVVSGVCDISKIKLTVSGITTITGTLNIISKRGTKTFNDFVVASAGTFTSTVSENFRINGNIQVNGTFNANLGIFTLAGIGKTITGTSVIIFDDVLCSGSYTNNASVKLLTSFKGTGTWTQGVTGMLELPILDVNFLITTFNAATVGNTVNYSYAGSQNVIAPSDGSYSNLILSGGGGATKILLATTTINRNLLISAATILNANNFNLNVGGNFTNNNVFTPGTATVTLNGTIAQAIGGTTATAFRNLTITNATAIVSANTNFSTSGLLTIGTGGILQPAPAVIVSGAGTLTGTGTARVTRILAIPDFVSQYTIAGKTLSGLNTDYIGAGNQNVNILNYGSLTISTNGARTVTFPAAVVGVSNVFSPSSTTTSYVIGGNTINFNGPVAQTIPSFNYNTLTSSSTGSRTLSSTGIIGVAAAFNPGVNGYTVVGSTINYNGAVAQNMTAFNYFNLTSSLTGTRTLAPAGIIGVAGAFTPGTNAYTITNSTVDFNGTIAQTIPAFNYNHLTSSSSGARVLASAGTIGVAGVFTPFTNSYTVSGSTVNFNGTVAQTIPAFNYNHLTSSSSGVRVLASSGIIGVADVFTPFTNTYTIAGSTLNFNGTVAQSIPVFNYFNLTSSSTGARILASAGTIGVAAAFTPGTNAYTVTNSTVDFNGSIAQTIPAFTYNNLISSGSSAKTLGGNIIVNNDITITSNLDVSASNFSVSVKRNWIKNGTFNAQAGAVVFNGSVAQTLAGTGTTTFHQLDINNTSGGVSLSSGSYLLNAVISPLNGNFNTGGMPFTMVSTASQTARIAPKGATASLSGNFTIQRFISARDTSYADLSSTVQSTSMLDWDNELPALSYVHSPPTAYASAYTYNESTDVFVPLTSSGGSLIAGKGYEVFLSGDYFYASLPATTVDAVGIPNQGTYNLSSLISNTAQGWNLVGNPFASSISWASVYTASGGASSGLYDFFEMYDYTIGDWSGYTSADGVEIGSGQGFWVYGLPGATSLALTVPETSKTTSSNSSIKAAFKNETNFCLKVSSPVNSFSHTFKVNATADASDELDSRDLPFRASPNKATPALYSILGGSKVNLNTFNSSKDEYAMSLSMKVSTKGHYKIEASGFEFLPEFSCIKLEDKSRGLMVDFTAQSAYEFDAFLLEDNNRFVLHFYKNGHCKAIETASQPMDGADLVEVLPYSDGNVLNFSFPEYTSVSVSVTNLLGQHLLPVKRLTAMNESETIQLPSDFHGVYFIQIASERGNIVKKIYKN